MHWSQSDFFSWSPINRVRIQNGVNKNNVFCIIIVFRNVGENHIASLQGRLFVNNTEMMDLILSHNIIGQIVENAFIGLDNLKYL